MSNEIKIVVYGQIHDDTKIGFTYPDKFNPSNSSSQEGWLRSLVDYRSDKRVSNTSPTYAYWKNEFGNYYGIIFPAINDKDNFFDEGIPRGGRLSIIVFTGRKIFVSGRHVIDLLNKLMTKTKNNELERNDSLIELLLNNAVNYLINDPISYNSTPCDLKAYRTYSSENGLEIIFQNPNQEENLNYKQILIVPQSSISTIPNNGEYKEITTPIRPTFSINKNTLPRGVEVDRYFIKEGDKLKIIYTQKGYETRTISVPIINSSTSFYSLNNSEIILFDAKTAGIKFQRIIRLYCFSGQTPIEVIRVKLEKNYLKKNDDGYYVFPDDKDSYEVTIEAPGYKKESFIVSQLDFSKGEKKVQMQPYEESVDLYLDSPNGIINGTVTLKTNDPLYRHLIKASQERIPINLYKIKSDGRRGASHPLSNHILKWALMFVGALFLLYLLYVLFCLLDLRKNPWPFEEKRQTTEQIDDSYKESTEGSIDPNINDDILLLKKNDVWKKEELKTDSFRVLLDYIHQGQIDQIVSKKWFPEDSINEYWKNIYDFISNKRNDSNVIFEASEELKRFAKNENNIELGKIASSMKLLEKKYNKQIDNSPTKQIGSQPAKSATKQAAPQPAKKTSPQPIKQEGSQPVKKSDPQPVKKQEKKEDPRGSDKW